MEGTHLLAMRCPVYRRRDSHPGFRAELENLVGDANGEGPSGIPARPTVPMRRAGADCSVVAMRRGNSRGAKGAGHRVGIDMGQLATGGTRWSRRKAPAFQGGTSRVTGDGQARIGERLGAKFPGPTRQQETEPSQTGLRWRRRKPSRLTTGRLPLLRLLDSTRHFTNCQVSRSSASL
jgi:hypothetical protein